MDYNYIRMRNAEHDGDKALAAFYRRKYESGIAPERNIHMIDGVNLLLAIVAVALFVYILITNML